MLHPRRRVVVAAGLLVATALSAGCAGDEAEVSATVCDFTSIFYENRLDRPTLRTALEAEGYRWIDEEDGVALAEPPAPQTDYVRVVFADPSISSGGGSVITVTETAQFAAVPGGPGRVDAAAQQVSALVNDTFPADEARIERWIAGEHLECPSSAADPVAAAVADAPGARPS